MRITINAIKGNDDSKSYTQQHYEHLEECRLLIIHMEQGGWKLINGQDGATCTYLEFTK